MNEKTARKERHLQARRLIEEAAELLRKAGDLMESQSASTAFSVLASHVSSMRCLAFDELKED